MAYIDNQKYSSRSPLLGTLGGRRGNVVETGHGVREDRCDAGAALDPPLFPLCLNHP